MFVKYTLRYSMCVLIICISVENLYFPLYCVIIIRRQILYIRVQHNDQVEPFITCSYRNLCARSSSLCIIPLYQTAKSGNRKRRTVTYTSSVHTHDIAHLLATIGRQVSRVRLGESISQYVPATVCYFVKATVHRRLILIIISITYVFPCRQPEENTRDRCYRGVYVRMIIYNDDTCTFSCLPHGEKMTKPMLAAK